MVDEYQDTNYIQYLWARLLALKHSNLFVVGDPDQSIYSWRGAEPYNITRFFNDFPNARVIKLEQNYRSTRYILEAANAVIRHNPSHENKILYANRGEGKKLVQYCAVDSFGEAAFIADTIADLVDRENGLSGLCCFLSNSCPVPIVGGSPGTKIYSLSYYWCS